MTTPNWEELTKEDDINIVGGSAPIDSNSDDLSDINVVDGSVLSTPPMDESGRVDNTLQLADFLGGQVGVRGAQLASEGLASLASSPILKSILGGAGRLLGGVGGEAVEQVAPVIGSDQPINPSDVLANATLSKVVGDRMPAKRGTGVMGLGPAAGDIEALARPEVQAAVRTGKFFDPNIGDADPKWLSSNTRAAIQGSEALAKDKVEGFGRALGVGAHSNTFARSLADEWSDKAGAVIDDAIFKKSKDIPELAARARASADNIWREGTSVLTQHRDELSLDPQDVLPLLKNAADTVSKLGKSTYGKEFAAGRSEAILTNLQDIQKLASQNGGKLDPVDAAELITTLNKYRREVLQEFDKATTSGLAQGQNVLKDKELTEGLRDVSTALNEAIGNKIFSAKNISPEDRDLLESFHDKYGGFSVVEKAADNFIQKAKEGAASKDAGKLVGSPGAREAGQELKMPTKAGWGQSVLNWFAGTPDTPVSPASSAYLRAQNRNTLGMEAVKDIGTMAENPSALNLPPMSPSPRDLRMDALRRQGAMTGAGIAAPLAARMGSPDQAQASEISTPIDSMINPDPFANGLPRDSSQWDDKAVARLLVDSATTPKGIVVQSLAVKFKEALRAQDQSKSERILADIAKIAPEYFEPGKGINGRLFHPDDQKEYMDRLYSAYRDGTVSADFLSKQQRAFSDPTNSLILPLELPNDKWRGSQPKDLLIGSKRDRGYLGGADAQIGPAPDSSPRLAPY